jgi:5-methylcytosine-specific restriction protein A
LKRDEFGKKTKLEAWTRCKGRCEGCGCILRPGHFDYDHIKPAAFNGKAVLDNIQVLCNGLGGCHSRKTFGKDIPAIAKSNRVRTREAGIRRKSKFQTSRDGPFKAKIGGGFTRRS